MTVVTLDSLPRRHRLHLSVPLLAGILILAGGILLALAPGLFAPYMPNAFDYKSILKPPSWEHPFGTDNFGRDMLSRVIYAYRIDMEIALLATLFPFCFGTLVGALVGYYGGWAEAILGRIVDALITETAKAGYAEYRTHLGWMDPVMETFDFNNHALRRFGEKVKNALDPNGIIAPGKQGIWPAAYSDARGRSNAGGHGA